MAKRKAKPHVYVIAGANGAGKTTFARVFLPKYALCQHFVNADLIASGLSPFSPSAVEIKAARLMLEQINSLAKCKVNFGFETTLSGRGHVGLLRSLKKHGYSIHLFFLWLPSAELALDRIDARVRQGGHSVPANVARRRFSRSLRNMFNLYLPLLDHWIIFDNSTDKPRVLAVEKAGKRRIMDDELFRTILAQAKP